MKVLVVVDMQNDFIDGVLGNNDTRAVVANVVDRINQTDADMIITTMDTHYEGFYLNSQERRILPVPHCIKMSQGWYLNSKVQEVLDKKWCEDEVPYLPLYKSTFASKDLPMTIANCMYEKADNNLQIELIGVCTDICVVSNALYLKASFPEAKITIDASCCAGTTIENHKAALTTMECCQCVIKNRK